jgi:hypothetical protein
MLLPWLQQHKLQYSATQVLLYMSGECIGRDTAYPDSVSQQGLLKCPCCVSEAEACR